MRTRLGYGWIPDLPDLRDRLYKMPRLGKLPPAVDLRPGCPAVYDQSTLGSCTAHAISAAIEFDQRKQNFAEPFAPSRLFIYYNERAIEGTIAADSGAMLRDGIKTVAAQGVCPEGLWPYEIEKFAEAPAPECYQVGRTHTAVKYSRLAQSAVMLKACLAEGYPFVFGFTVYESFESEMVAQTGIVPMPEASEAVLGGHAVTAVGYDDASQRFLVRNSWSKAWGNEGYFTIPYAYLATPDLADDFWTIRVVK